MHIRQFILLPSIANQRKQKRGPKSRQFSLFSNVTLSVFALIFSIGTFASEQTISFGQAIAKSLQSHPQLTTYYHQAKAYEGAITQAGVSSPMSLTVKVEDAFGTGEFANIQAMQTSLSIAWLLEQAQVDARVSFVSEQARLTELERQNQALKIAANTANIYITLLAQKQSLKLAQLSLAQASKSFEAIGKRVSAGNAHQVDKLRSNAVVAQKALQVEDLHHEIDASREQLAAQWGGTSNFVVTGELGDIPSVPTIDEAYKALKQHPKYKQLAAKKRITDSAVAVVKANELPAWQVNAGIKRNEMNDDIAFMAGINIPLGSKNRNVGQIAKLQAEQSQEEAEVNAWQKVVSTNILLETHKLKHNRHVIESLTEGVIPALESANQQAEQAYLSGFYRYSEWYEVQQELNDSQLKLIEAYSNVHKISIELQRLTGTATNL